MLERFRQFWTNVWAPLADLLLRIGVKPDHVTIVSTIGVCAGALWFFPRGQFFVGVMVVTAFVFGDIMDGYMARKTGQSSTWGAFLDSTLDRFGDAAIFGGLVLYYAQSDAETDLGGPTLYLCLSLACLVLGNITSYARARAESLGMKAKGGIAERADRLVAILVMTGFNGLLGLPFLTEITLWALTAASSVTIVQRMVMVHRQAAGNPAPPQAGRPPGNE